MADRYYTNQYTGDKIITWKNFTDTSTPLSAANLQKSHSAINAIDQSVRAAFNSVDNTKLDKTSAASMISDIEFNQTTGILIFHHYDTSIPDIVFNTNLQKVVVNFTYDPATQSLVLTQADNTVVRIDLSDFISTPDVANSDTVAWTINQDGSVSADIIDGSITEDKLEEHYLESILDQVATVSRLTNNSEYFSKLAKSYANGTSNLSDRPNENVDNSKYYMEQSQRSAIICGSILHIAGQNASDSEAYGAGTRDGEPVSSDDPAYHNNSKYYMEEAKEAVIKHLPVMTGATATTDGQQGAAPKPLAGQQDNLLTGGAQYKSLDQLGIQKQVLASAMTIGGQTVTQVEPALRALNEKGGGHTILDEDGNTYPQRSKLQFKGCEVTDDETNDTTVVDIDPTLRDAEVIEGKNLFSETYTNRFVFGSTQDGYNINGNANGFVAIGKVEPGNDYVVSKNNLGNAFRVVLFKAYPVYTVSQLDATQLISEQGTSRTDYSFTVPSAYNYVAVGFNRDSAYTGSITPMLCTLSEWQKSHDYEPFYVPVKDAMLRRSEQRVLGAKNLCPNNAVDTTNRGITYVVNSDKTIKGNGTATGGSSSLEIYKGTLTPGDFILSGGISDYYCVGLRETSASSWIGRSAGNDVPVTIEENVSYTIFVWIKDGITANNVVFKPMLRLASDPDDTYVPYAMTNRELTEVKTYNVSYTDASSSISGISFDVQRVGKVVQFGIYFSITSQMSAGATVELKLVNCPLPSYSGMRIVGLVGSIMVIGWIENTGKLKIRFFGTISSGSAIVLTGTYITNY